jgi:hypothetical protein
MVPIPISDDEHLLRRIPRGAGGTDYYNPDRPQSLSPDAFKPHASHDMDGLSLSRAKSPEHPEFLLPEDLAALGQSPHGYFIAELVAGDLRRAGIEVVPDPLPSDPGHVLLPHVNSSNRKSNEVAEIKQRLKTLTREIHGPFLIRRP